LLRPSRAGTLDRERESRRPLSIIADKPWLSRSASLLRCAELIISRAQGWGLTARTVR
jgi:hypothetical protein